MYVEAISPPYEQFILVEMSGTAPESITSIVYNVYYHSNKINHHRLIIKYNFYFVKLFFIEK